MCSARFVYKENEEQKTCEMLKNLEKYIVENNLLVDLSHLVIGRCLGYENKSLRYYILEPMSKINVYLPGQSPSTHFTTLPSQLSKIEAGDVKYILFQLAIALKVYHDNQLIHGDIEMDNIIIN